MRKNLTIINFYPEDDEFFDGESHLTALIDNNGHEYLQSGDYYHDKIDDRIEGFLEGLDYAGIQYLVSYVNVATDKIPY